ncbi:unnamed protein product [Paramecium sonneborni]|uniref:Uncharacterized protein n=1 Tax=Paramecium sonneborni TaxID=65129 RepID=A0A8S1MXX3_9CILI|nr:unnamed protein product [Paramecium sonneborni]
MTGQRQQLSQSYDLSGQAQDQLVPSSRLDKGGHDIQVSVVRIQLLHRYEHSIQLFLNQYYGTLDHQLQFQSLTNLLLVVAHEMQLLAKGPKQVIQVQ